MHPRDQEGRANENSVSTMPGPPTRSTEPGVRPTLCVARNAGREPPGGRTGSAELPAVRTSPRRHAAPGTAVDTGRPARVCTAFTAVLTSRRRLPRTSTPRGHAPRNKHQPTKATSTPRGHAPRDKHRPPQDAEGARMRAHACTAIPALGPIFPFDVVGASDGAGNDAVCLVEHGR